MPGGAPPALGGPSLGLSDAGLHSTHLHACMALTHACMPPGVTRGEYYLEFMKGVQIIETRPAAGRDHLTFGRSPACDFPLEHPSASRLHAVLQFRAGDGAAFLYDAASAHGTFLNRRRLRPRAHAPLRCVGDPPHARAGVGAAGDRVMLRSLAL